eukprot:TRINITY_DN330_c0_g1_i1.p1 TRINITY_DN330_c0_g1~~TRINITY_DN330_c0_g1_i1.p1  ORF type:complete len:512 (+),score=130.41 TRINITY_DN330_c0_g1_i1:297-1832(+)
MASIYRAGSRVCTSGFRASIWQQPAISLTGCVSSVYHAFAPELQLERIGQRGYRSVVHGAVPGVSESRDLGSHGSQELMEMEDKHSAHNYHPLPVVFSRAKGANVWDPEGHHYLDFLSAYSAVNQGHGNERILHALEDQLYRCTLTSRAFYNDKFPVFAKMVTNLFGYDSMLPMNTGAEGVETALKLARKWGYEKKKIPKNEALTVSCCGCFHGRTLGAISMSCDNEATRGFWPLVPGNEKVDFGDIEALRRIFEEKGERVAAFLFEPIQGEAGVKIPPSGYLTAVQELCSKHNVLMVADEIQTGLARTGRMLACDWEGVRPDIVILGKALGGGVLPVSAVLADTDVMECIRPGEHGSTFGGNPLASAVAMASLEVLVDDKLAERADKAGEELRKHLEGVQSRFPQLIKEVRGRGLLNAVEMNSSGLAGVTAWDVCLGLKERGVLAKPTHNTIIRLAPPLTISHENLKDAADALEAVLQDDLPGLKRMRSSSSGSHGHTPEPCDRCGRVIY